MLEFSEIEQATGGDLIKPKQREIKGFSIDSRTLGRGDFFIPLPGSNTDGHCFLEEAFDKGASGAIIESKEYDQEGFFNLIVVEDPEEALLNMARFHRRNFQIPIIGVTGSWGKTTTKELISSVLSVTKNVYKSPGNFNTEYGLPLAMLEMTKDVEVGVFELGLQYPEDIRILSEVLAPTCGLVTGVGKAHIVNFQSEKDIAKEKLKITKGMKKGSKILLNVDSRPLRQESTKLRNFNLVNYGVGKESSKDYYATNVQSLGLGGITFNLEVSASKETASSTGFPFSIKSGLNSKANVYNVLAASCLSLELGEEPQVVQKGVNIDPLPQRLAPQSFPQGVLIDDTYNASPSATKNALVYLKSLEVSGEKILVFADMLELGEQAKELHQELAQPIRKANIDRLLTVGVHTKNLVSELTEKDYPKGRPKAEWFPTKENLLEKLRETLKGTDNLIFVKGSRSMKMEQVVDSILENF